MNQPSNRKATTMSQVASFQIPGNGNRSLPSRPGQPLRPLRPRNTNNAALRDMYRSMIPIRAHLPADVAPVTPTNVINFQINNPPQHQPARPPRHRHTVPSRATNANATHQALAMSLSETQTILQSVETAFTVYGERLQADLRDFRALCTTLLVKEHEEKERWHSLCMKVMKERDVAKQRVQDLVSSSSFASKGKGKGGVVAVPAPSVSPPASPRGSKRSREDISDVQTFTNAVPVGARSSTSPTLETGQRPMCTMKTSASPIHSPPGSPYTPISPLLPPLSSSTEIDSSIPPVSAVSSAESPSHTTSGFSSTVFGSTVTATVVSEDARSKRVSGSRSPSLSFSISSSSSSPSLSSSKGFLPPAEEEQAPPMKKRKSCDTQLKLSGTTGIGSIAAEEDVKPVSTTLPPSLSSKVEKPADVHYPGEFLHVDIMYVPTNGKLVCRACLLNSTKRSLPVGSSAEARANCKSFPTDVSWDDLRDHCLKEHPDACADVARLHPAEVFEVRRRMNL